MAPFKSEAQRAFFHVARPDLVEEFESHTPKGKKLPKRVKSAKVPTKKKVVKETNVKKKNSISHKDVGGEKSGRKKEKACCKECQKSHSCERDKGKKGRRVQTRKKTRRK